MKVSIYFGSAILAATLAGCATTVRMSLQNGTANDQATEIDYTNSDGVPQNPISVGNVPANSTVTVSDFDVDHGGSVRVISTLQSGAQDDDSGSRTVFKSPDPWKWTYVIKGGGNVINDHSADLLMKDLSQLGPNLGFLPLSTQNALSSVYGGLECYIAGKESSTTISITPANFSNEVDFANFAYPSSNNTQTVDVTASASAKLSVSVPLFASISGNVENDTVSKVAYSMSGFGRVHKTDPNSWNVIVGLNNLPQAAKDAIVNLMNDQQAACTYVNDIYVIKSATFSTTNGVQLTSGMSVTSADVVSGNAAYTFSDQASANKSFNDEVFNAWGDTFRVAKLNGVLTTALAPNGTTLGNAATAVATAANPASPPH